MVELHDPFFDCDAITSRVWVIHGPANEQMYLATGAECAMLVDTGMGVGDLAGFVRRLTDLPVMVINTHGHPDHAGGNPGFKEAWLHPADVAILQKMCTDEYRLNDLKAFHGESNPEFLRLAQNLVRVRPYRLQPLAAGQVIDLGESVYEVLPLPGHTPGSVCLLNSREKILFSGDSIIATDAWLYLSHALPLRRYSEALKRVRQRQDEFELILPGHAPTPIGKEYLNDLIACTEEILNNPRLGEPVKTFVGEGFLWKHGKGSIIYNQSNLS